MKLVKIPAWSRGLVYRNGRYIKTLKEGTQWLWGWDDVFKFPMNQIFTTVHDINLLLEDAELAKELSVLKVKEGEIALKFENGLFENVIAPGAYGYWKGMVNYEFIKADISKIEIPEAIERNIIARAEMAMYVRSFVVESYEKGVLFIDGKNSGKLEPGVYYYWKNPVILQVVKADTRLQELEISGQEILTKDKAGVRINFQAQYKVVDIEQAVTQNKEYAKQLYILLQLALRDYVGGYSLDELLSKKDELSAAILTASQAKVVQLGVSLVSCGIRDIILPGEIKDIMNQVMIAEKKAQANIITRREETASTRSLLNTAKLLEENEMLFRLKELEYVEKIADKINSISLSNGGLVIDQLKGMFIGKKV